MRVLTAITLGIFISFPVLSADSLKGSKVWRESMGNISRDLNTLPECNDIKVVTDQLLAKSSMYSRESLMEFAGLLEKAVKVRGCQGISIPQMGSSTGTPPVASNYNREGIDAGQAGFLPAGSSKSGDTSPAVNAGVQDPLMGLPRREPSSEESKPRQDNPEKQAIINQGATVPSVKEVAPPVTPSNTEAVAPASGPELKPDPMGEKEAPEQQETASPASPEPEPPKPPEPVRNFNNIQEVSNAGKLSAEQSPPVPEAPKPVKKESLPIKEQVANSVTTLIDGFKKTLENTSGNAKAIKENTDKTVAFVIGGVILGLSLSLIGMLIWRYRRKQQAELTVLEEAGIVDHDHAQLPSLLSTLKGRFNRAK